MNDEYEYNYVKITIVTVVVLAFLIFGSLAMIGLYDNLHIDQYKDEACKELGFDYYSEMDSEFGGYCYSKEKYQLVIPKNIGSFISKFEMRIVPNNLSKCGDE